MEILGFPISEGRKTDNGCWDYQSRIVCKSFSFVPVRHSCPAGHTSLPCLVVSPCEWRLWRNKSWKDAYPHRPNHQVSHSSLCLSLGYQGSGISWKLIQDGLTVISQLKVGKTDAGRGNSTHKGPGGGGKIELDDVGFSSGWLIKQLLWVYYSTE